MRGLTLLLVALSLLFAFTPIGPSVIPDQVAIEQPEDQACRPLRAIGRGLRGLGRGVGRAFGRGSC